MADRGDRPPRDDLVYGLQPVREALRGRRRVREVVCTREAAEAMPWIESSGREDVDRRRRSRHGARRAARPPGRRRAVRSVPVCGRRRSCSRARTRSSSRSTASPTPATSARSRAPASASALTASSFPVTALRASLPSSRRPPRARSSTCRSPRSRTSPSCCAATSARTSGATPPPRTRDATPDALDLTGGVVLVLGAEGTGIRPLVRQRCDAAVRIPMHGQIGSLNVAVAASLLLYEADRQRRTASP